MGAQCLSNPAEPIHVLGGRTATYTLDLGKADSARIYQPQASQVAMSRTRLRTQGGKITLAVTETPQFVLAGGG